MHSAFPKMAQLLFELHFLPVVYKGSAFDHGNFPEFLSCNMGSAVGGVIVIGGLLFGIPLMISIIRAIRNLYFERRERRADLRTAAERRLNGFNTGNNDGSPALDGN